MCQAIIRITSKSLEGVNNVALLRKIKDDIALFIQTMEVRHPVAGFAFPLLTVQWQGLGLFRLHGE